VEEKELKGVHERRRFSLEISQGFTGINFDWDQIRKRNVLNVPNKGHYPTELL